MKIKNYINFINEAKKEIIDDIAYSSAIKGKMRIIFEEDNLLTAEEYITKFKELGIGPTIILEMATEFGKVDIIKLIMPEFLKITLIKDIVMNRYETPKQFLTRELWYATKTGNIDIVKLYVENGVNLKKADMEIALLYAQYHSREEEYACFEVIKYLVEKSGIKKLTGNAHLQEALRKNSTEIAEYIWKDLNWRPTEAELIAMYKEDRRNNSCLIDWVMEDVDENPGNINKWMEIFNPKNNYIDKETLESYIHLWEIAMYSENV